MGHCCDRLDCVFERTVKGLWDFGWETSLNAESSVNCSAGTWKIRLLKVVQMLEAGFVKFPREAKNSTRTFVWRIYGVWSNGAVINKRPELLKWTLRLAETIDAAQLGPNDQPWWRRDHCHRGDVCREVFPRVQHTEAVFQNWPRLYLKLAVKLGVVSQSPRWLKAWKCHGERLRLGTMWQGWSLLVKVRFHQGIPEVLKMSELWDGHQDSISGRREPVGAAGTRAGEVTQDPHRSPEHSKWILNFGYWINLNYNFGIWVFFCLSCDCALVFSSWSEKVFNLLLASQELTVFDFKRDWLF